MLYAFRWLATALLFIYVWPDQRFFAGVAVGLEIALVLRALGRRVQEQQEEQALIRLRAIAQANLSAQQQEGA